MTEENNNLVKKPRSLVAQEAEPLAIGRVSRILKKLSPAEAARVAAYVNEKFQHASHSDQVNKLNALRSNGAMHQLGAERFGQ